MLTLSTVPSGVMKNVTTWPSEQFTRRIFQLKFEQISGFKNPPKPLAFILKVCFKNLPKSLDLKFRQNLWLSFWRYALKFRQNLWLSFWRFRFKNPPKSRDWPAGQRGVAVLPLLLLVSQPGLSPLFPPLGNLAAHKLYVLLHVLY